MEQAVTEMDAQVSAAHGQVLDFTREMEAREGENNVLRAGIEHAQSDEARIGHSVEEAKKRLEQLNALTEESTGDAQARFDALGAGRAELEALEKELDAAQRRADAAEETLNTHKAAIIDAMNRLSDVRTSQTRLTTMRQTLEKRLEELSA